ncbi:MAG: enolase-phosphatase E1 [Pycnora praestabilis]|nr:MAG: enolase-phosphatase E1 [Pycnora praestabilis]
MAEPSFPYALEALPLVLTEKWDDPDFMQYRDSFPEDVRRDPQALEDHVRQLTREDIKAPYLKNLQGYLWKTGYRNGAITAPLFPDVAPFMLEWIRSRRQIAIYSSGSVSAQKLLFQHTSSTPESDLSPLISGYFDTVNAGPKAAERSYATVAKALGKEVGDIWFLSDNVKEVDAALKAGMESTIVVRPGNAPLSEEEIGSHHCLKTLENVTAALREEATYSR